MYKSFEEMPVWQKAFDLADKIYDFTEEFPKAEMYSLCDQLKRSAVSVSANVAESFGRQHTSDKINFYYFARGSLTETKSHLLFALKRGFITDEQYNTAQQIIEAIYRDINSIIKSLKTKSKSL